MLAAGPVRRLLPWIGSIAMILLCGGCALASSASSEHLPTRVGAPQRSDGRKAPILQPQRSDGRKAPILQPQGSDGRKAPILQPQRSDGRKPPIGSAPLSSASPVRPQGSAADAQVLLDPIASTIGPLFDQGISGDHHCTASVLDSPGGNLILTAAHCVAGSGAGLLFAPGYHDGVAPFGFWTVEHAYADPAWLTDQDDDHDYVILQVANREQGGGAATLEATTGGNRLGMAPNVGDAVTVIGYNAGANDEPIRCDVIVRDEGTYPAFDCAGFSGGTSGGPWLAQDSDHGALTIRGLIGGLNQGGCVDWTSYSSSFGQPILDLLSQAVAGGSPSILPEPHGSGC
jgi:Trypsin-like peptidase domain